MRKLLNTLYITSDDLYLALDGENVVAKRDGKIISRYPLHILDNIITFSYLGASPALMGYCAEHLIGLAFCKPNGRMLARVSEPVSGNILLRREQYRIADDSQSHMPIVRNMLTAKLHNQRQVLERAKRNHGMSLDVNKFNNTSKIIYDYMSEITGCNNPDEIRGIEGLAAKSYFNVFDDMILAQKPIFMFRGRSKRPPLDRPNAMLSFGYVILANECASALASHGLDPYAGFLHRDKPGRKSLALDIMEEFRGCLVDRHVLTMLNNRQMNDDDFNEMENGVVLLSNSGRQKFLKAWTERKEDQITHPYTGEKMPRGLLPYIQAQLLARFLRGDIDGYPAYLWR